MKIPVKKCLFLTMAAAIVLTGWQGIGAGYASVSGPREIPSSDVSGLTVPENTDEQAVIPDISTSLNDLNNNIEQYSRNILSLNTRWTVEEINAISSLNINGNVPVLIAVLDTGIDKYHEDLKGKVAAEVNLSASDTAGDIYGHGTSIAGIIAAEADNDLGISGIAPGSRLLNVKVADDRGRCESPALAGGIIWAVDNGARVINISLEIKDFTDELKEAVDYAWEKGAVIIAAAGNDGSTSPAYPASLDNCLAVTAVKDNNTLVPMANYGDWVDLGAPGYKIYTTLPGDKYGYKYGTSFATAYISGLAGTLFSMVTDTNGNGRLNDEVRRMIEAGYKGLSSP